MKFKYISLLNLSLIVLLLSACQPTQSLALTATPSPSIIYTPTPQPATLTPTPIPATPTATPEPYLQVNLEALNGTRVRFWHPWNGKTALELVSLVDEFNRTNQWGIFVEAREVGSAGQLFTALQVEWQNPQTRPHLIAASNDQLLALQLLDSTNTSNNEPQESSIINLNAYINHPEAGMTLEETMDFPLVFWEQDEVDGFRLGIPVQRNASLLFYNLSWAKELGFSNPPTTPEEFKEQACAAASTWIKDPDPNNRGTGGWIISTDPLAVLSWMFAFGADRMPDAPDGEYILNTPAVVEALTFLQDLYKQGCAWVSRYPESDQYFANRQAIFYSGSLLEVLLQSRVMENAGNKDEWIVLPYPHQAGIPVMVVGGSSMAILRSSPEEQMSAWLFTRWLLSPERLARLDSVSGSLPVRISSLSHLDNFRKRHPQWSAAFSWLPWAQPAPRQPSWRSARWVISDAAWNIFNPNILPTPIPAILDQAEVTIREILDQP